MRIAILEPYIEGVGGAQKVISDYGVYLQNRGYDIEIFTQRYDPSTAYPAFKEMKVNLLSPKNKLFVPFIYLFKKFKDFDVVLANDWPTNFASIRNKNVMWICYSPKRDFYDLREYYFKRASLKKKALLTLKRILFKKIDDISVKKMRKIATNSGNVKKRVRKYHKTDSEVCYHGISYEKYKQGKYNNYLLSVARLEKPKRVEAIIKSMKYVKSKKVRLYVVGDGPDKEKIKRLCEDYENVRFLGRVSEKKLIGLYANCLGAISVPVNEDWGLIPLEAAASGKLVIGADEGGLKESVINGETGFLLDEVSPRSIAEKINYLADNKKIAIKMGKKARKHIKKFDWEVLMPKLEKMIKELHSSN